MNFSINIELAAVKDIQDAIDWYNSQEIGLGERFYNEIDNHFEVLKTNPFFQIRYDNVRCLPLKNFPYMIHFTVDEVETVVVIRAVLNTSRDITKLK